MGLVIDTSALVALERAQTPWMVPASLGEAEVAVPAIVYAELLAGVHLADTPVRAAARQAKVDALVARVPIVEFDLGVARLWAGLFAVLSRSGNLVPSNDLTVAATAMSLGSAVLVGPSDEARFRRIPDLAVEPLVV